jgi:lysophospholipase L1-like esterase
MTLAGGLAPEDPAEANRADDPRSGTGRAKLRRRASEALLVLGALAVSLPLAEIVLRVLAPQRLPSQELVRGFVLKGMYLPDAPAGYRPTPGFSGKIERDGYVTQFATNSLGLRGGEVGPKTRPRLLALGDSITWGWAVPQGEEWVHWAGREIARLGGPEVESLNGGVNGYGTQNEAARLEQLGSVLSPDLVLVGFFDNDYADNFFGVSGTYTVRDGYLFDIVSHEWLREHWLARESHLWRLWTSAWEACRVRYLGAAPSARPARRLSGQELWRGMELSEKHLRRMAETARSLDARLGVVWLPLHTYTLAGFRPEDLPLQRELQRRVAAAGIPSLDLLPVMTAEPQREDLYLPRDGHFSVRGHQVVGRAVARWVLEAGLLSPAGR